MQLLIEKNKEEIRKCEERYKAEKELVIGDYERRLGEERERAQREREDRVEKEGEKWAAKLREQWERLEKGWTEEREKWGRLMGINGQGSLLDDIGRQEKEIR